MREKERGQIIILTAFTLIAALFILAVLIDGSRLLVKRQELNRIADAAGKAGLIVVGDHMVTQAAEAQAAGNGITPTAALEGENSEMGLTPTPEPDDLFSWITNDHRKTLVAPPMQTLVATNVLGGAEENGLGLGDPSVINIEIVYPVNYTPTDQVIRIKVRIEKIETIIFKKLLGLEDGVLSGDAEEKIPQR